MKIFKDNWHRIVLLLIVALAGFLSFYNVGSEGYANSYYSAAVKSMLTGWHNFFYASFDPGGFVSVDKPALGLWLQVLSARIFGFYGWSLILPEALSAVISVLVLYHLVKRGFGRTAGIASALVFALTPILIAVSRTNNLDASLVMVLLLAAWALIAASEKNSFKYLVLSAALVGLGFNIKMLEAFMILPAFYLVYLFTSSLKTGRKLLHLTGATAVLLAVSLSWAAAVDLTPAGGRPYVGSSQTNSVIELALGYNGIQRITGMTGMGNADSRGTRDMGDGRGEFEGTDNGPGNSQQSGGRQTPPADGNQSSTGGADGTAGQIPQNRADSPDRTGQPSGDNTQGRPADGAGNAIGQGGPGGSGENGQKGFLRILNRQLAGQIGWMMPMALFGIAILILKTLKTGAADRRKVLRHLLLWSAWILPMLVYFSISGFFHRYYLSMLAPGIAALSGIGIVEMWKGYMGRGWKWIMLPAALIANAALQAFILSRYPQWSSRLTPVICGLALAAVAALAVIRLLKKDDLVKTIKAFTAAGFAALLIAPAIWAYTPILYGSETHLPYAGPELSSNSNEGQGGGASDEAVSKLIEFLTANRQGEKYLAAVPNATTAAPIILKTGEPVIAVGGYKGTDNILTAEALENMVNNGEIRYYVTNMSGPGNMQILPQTGSFGGSTGSKPAGMQDQGGEDQGTVGNGDSRLSVTEWVVRNGTPVSPGQLGSSGMTVYDLAPSASKK